jgi:hypothetical protein
VEIGRYLGDAFASRDPAHIQRWLAAMAAGRARLRCVAVSRSGERCRNHTLKFSDKCRNHCKGAERDRVDEKRLAWLERNLHRNWGERQLANVRVRIGKIRRRRLHRL